jgi:hypothetical protein
MERKGSALFIEMTACGRQALDRASTRTNFGSGAGLGRGSVQVRGDALGSYDKPVGGGADEVERITGYDG